MPRDRDIDFAPTLPTRFSAGARPIAGTYAASTRWPPPAATPRRVAAEQSAQAAMLGAAIAGREGPWRSPA